MMMNNMQTNNERTKCDAEVDMSYDAEIIMFTEMGFDANQAKLAMEANDGNVDAALDDLCSGISFSSKEISPKQEPIQSHADDDEMMMEKRLQHPIRAVSAGIDEWEVSPPQHASRVSSDGIGPTQDEESLQYSNHAYAVDKDEEEGGTFELSPPHRQYSDDKLEYIGDRPVAHYSSSDTKRKAQAKYNACPNIAAEHVDEARVGAVAVAGAGRDVETGDHITIISDPLETERRNEQRHEAIQSELIEAELVLPSNIERAPSEARNSSKEESHPYWTKNRILLAALILLLIVGAAIMGTVLALNKEDPDPTVSSEGSDTIINPTQGSDTVQGPTEGPVVVPTEEHTVAPTPAATPAPTPVPTQASTPDPEESTEFVPSSANSGWEHFGGHLAISRDGTTIVVGAEVANYVEVYRRIGGRWTKVGDRLEGDGQFGRCVDVSADGSMIIVGAWNGGYATAFRFDGSVWTKVGGTLRGDGSDDKFGWSVSMADDGRTVAVSAREGDLNGLEHAGYVRIYTLDSSDEWAQLGTELEGKANNEEFGRAMAFASNGRRLAVGTTKWNDLVGIVRVFDFVSGDWNHIDANSDVLKGKKSGDYFGSGLALSTDGNIIAVGADGVNNRAGLVRTFQWNGSQWAQHGNDMPGSGGALGMHQVALSTDGSCLVAGASRINNNMGEGYIYEFNNNEWKMIVKLSGRNSNDRFAESVSVSGDCTIAVFGAMESGSQPERPGYFKVYTRA